MHLFSLLYSGSLQTPDEVALGVENGTDGSNITPPNSLFDIVSNLESDGERALDERNHVDFVCSTDLDWIDVRHIAGGSPAQLLCSLIERLTSVFGHRQLGLEQVSYILNTLIDDILETRGHWGPCRQSSQGQRDTQCEFSKALHPSEVRWNSMKPSTILKSPRGETPND